MLAEMVLEKLMAKYPCIKPSRTFPGRYYINPGTDERGRYCDPQGSIKVHGTLIIIDRGAIFDLSAPNSVQEFYAEIDRILSGNEHEGGVCW